MANPSKAKGTAWETAVVRFLQASGFPEARRTVQAGALDRGDIGGLPGFVLEAKAAQTFDLSGWVAQANREAVNAGALFGAVVAKKPRAKVQDGYVVLDLETFVRVLPYVETAIAAEGAGDLAALFGDRDEGRPWVYLDEVEERLKRTLVVPRRPSP